MGRPSIFFYAVAGHEVAIEFHRMGMFRIFHDQVLVGEGRSLYGRRRHTTFAAQEDAPVTYEVEVRAWGGYAPWIRLTRDGRDIVGWRR